MIRLRISSESDAARLLIAASRCAQEETETGGRAAVKITGGDQGPGVEDVAAAMQGHFQFERHDGTGSFRRQAFDG